MKKTKNKNRFFQYVKESFFEFINSFRKLNINLLFVITMDLLFLAVSYLVIFILGKILTNQALQLQGLTIAAGQLEQAQSTLATLSKFMYSLIISTVVLAVFILFNWSFFKLAIWNLVLKGKIELKKFWKFVLANVVWFFVWLVPFILAFYPLVVVAKFQGQIQKPPWFPLITLIIIFIALLHFTYLYYIGFVKEHKIGKAIAFAFKTGTVKIRFLLMPYLFILIGFAIISLITYPLKFAPDKVDIVVGLILLFAYLGWIRFYMAKTVLAIKEHKIVIK